MGFGKQGTHVPLIVRFPPKYQHLAPAKPGSVIDDPVTLLDLGPSVLRLAGVKVPKYMDGRPTLCRGNKPRAFCPSVSGTGWTRVSSSLVRCEMADGVIIGTSTLTFPYFSLRETISTKQSMFGNGISLLAPES